MIGKRKRETTVLRRPQQHTIDPGATESSIKDIDKSDIFRKYFEATFSPLPTLSLTTQDAKVESGDHNNEAQLSDNSDSYCTDSEWSGISSEPAAHAAVEVVDYTSTLQTKTDDPIEEIFQKSFMSSRPPREVQPKSQSYRSLDVKDEDAEDDTVNLKHDLDLQRLLRESHLLEDAKKKMPGGAQRHKATDLRLQSVGSKTSLFAQAKMPMSHRKGIKAKATSKDEHRRKEARENGIVLEKTSKKSSKPSSRRDRGVDVPVVGKFRSGTLQLSRLDVTSIQGSRRVGAKRGRR